jgi:hypothetical protein
MKKLIRQIIKEESLTQTKLLKVIEKLGILQTIKMVGGYEMFDKIYHEYFNDKSHKIDLINDICESDEDDSGGYIYFYELNGDDIEYANWEEDNTEYHSVLTYVQPNQVVGQIFMRDLDEEDFNDESIDNFIVPLKQLEGPTLNKIFELLVYHYL